MRNRSLHDALREFALEAAALLSADLEAGAELSFDVAAAGRRGGVLYSYRPLTAEFVRDRWERLRALRAFEPAVRALGSGAAAYLRVLGEAGGADPEPALRAMLERLYEDAARFDFPEERFERVYAEVERTLYEHAMRVLVAAPLRGLTTQSDRVELGDGLALVRADWTDAPVEAADEAAAVCLLGDDVEMGAPLPLARATARFAALQTALRLFEAGAVALGSNGWARADSGPWQRFPLGPPAPPRGPAWELARADEAELRELLDAVARSRHGGPVAWALERFELGCERGTEVQALSDHLLAIGALLDARDEAGRASLPLRLAALCAEEGGRRAVQRRVERAYALERFLVAGGGPAYVDAIGSEAPAELVADVEGYVRALLRDVLCGHLDPDLRSVADDILLASGEPFEIRARDMRREPPGGGDAEEPATSELEAVPREPDPDPDPDPGVTPSADWDFDEDPQSYSAPV